MASQPYQRATRGAGHGLEKFLGELELAVMEVVWQQQPVTVRAVLAALQPERELAYTTVMTIMGRLTEKGWLRATKQGRAYLYQAAHSRSEAEALAVGAVVRSLLQDFGEVAVAQFVREVDEVDPSQLARLAELIQEAEERHDD